MRGGTAAVQALCEVDDLGMPPLLLGQCVEPCQQVRAEHRVHGGRFGERPQ
jgi:hypothetical protein